MATKRSESTRDLKAENEAEVRDELRRQLDRHGAAKEMATTLGCSDPYLSMVKNGHRSMPARIAAMLGYRRVIRWERVER